MKKETTRDNEKWKKKFSITSIPSIDPNLVRCIKEVLSTAIQTPIHKTADPTTWKKVIKNHYCSR